MSDLQKHREGEGYSVNSSKVKPTRDDLCPLKGRLRRYTICCRGVCQGEGMSSLKEFQCEICGIVSENPIHWFVIECADQKLAVIKWDLTAAKSPTARHFCGEAHA